MDETQSSAITLLLSKIENGESEAFDALYNLVYNELKNLAAIQRARWDGDFTLNTTALVHEAYEKLVKTPNKQWEDHKHFYRVAAKAMRQVLYTHAEGKMAQKRGGDVKKISLDGDIFEDGFSMSENRILEVITMEQAMQKLEEISPRECNIVEYRFYLGLNVDETAKIMQLGTATIKRGWAFARAWLYKELNTQ